MHILFTDLQSASGRKAVISLFDFFDGHRIPSIITTS